MDFEDGSFYEELDENAKKEKKIFSRSVSVGGCDAVNSKGLDLSSTESKNRKRNSSYEQSLADDGNDCNGDFHTRPSPALERVILVLMKK